MFDSTLLDDPDKSLRQKWREGRGLSLTDLAALWIAGWCGLALLCAGGLGYVIRWLVERR